MNTGMGFFKMADVIDECPPLAKLFEGGLERFEEVFQVKKQMAAGGRREKIKWGDRTDTPDGACSMISSVQFIHHGKSIASYSVHATRTHTPLAPLSSGVYPSNDLQ